MATRVPTSRHHGESLADGRSTSRGHSDEDHPSARRDRRPEPAPSDQATPGTRPTGGHGRGDRRASSIRISETDARLWFG